MARGGSSGDRSGRRNVGANAAENSRGDGDVVTVVVLLGDNAEISRGKDAIAFFVVVAVVAVFGAKTEMSRGAEFFAAIMTRADPTGVLVVVVVACRGGNVARGGGATKNELAASSPSSRSLD